MTSLLARHIKFRPLGKRCSRMVGGTYNPGTRQWERQVPCGGRLRYEDFYDVSGYWVFIECPVCHNRWVKDAA